MVNAEVLDFSDLEAQYTVPEQDVLAPMLIVDNVPVVPAAKVEKLLQVLRKIFSRFDHALPDTAFHMPMTDKGDASKGFMFVDCESAEAAADIAKKADNYRLDTKHTFSVIKFSDFDKYMQVPDEYTPPKFEEYHQVEGMQNWLQDDGARDQFFCLAGDEVSIFWNNKQDDPEVVHRRSNWTDTYLQWSPKGTFLSTFHKQGIGLWGGEGWERIVRFVHAGVKLIDFSPQENYLVTWSNESPSEKNDNLRIWDIRTGKLLRGFTTPPMKDQLEWPMFKWSHNDEYIARASGESIYVYDLPNLSLVDNKPIKIDDLKDFSWSPTENVIAYWTPELENSPARVTVMEFPCREILRTKNLFNVSECALYWQSAGDYLAVRVDRYTKNRKGTYTNIEIFCLREKLVPIDVFEGLKEKMIQSLAWEPNGDRFAVIAQEGQKVYVGFYRMVKDAVKGLIVTELLVVERKGASNLFWSPKGRFCVVAGLRTMTGELEFWDVDELVPTATGEHFQATEIEWDCTGRYLSSGVSFWRYQGDNGYTIWDFKGVPIIKKSMAKFKQFLWRPRGPALLSKQQMKKVRKNLKEFSAKFDEIDNENSGAAAQQASAQRKKILKEWTTWSQACEKRYAAEREERALIRGGGEDPEYSDVEEDEEDVEEWVEEVVETVVTVVQ